MRGPVIRGRVRPGAVTAAIAVITAAGVLTACTSPASPGGAAGGGSTAVPSAPVPAATSPSATSPSATAPAAADALATSLAVAGESWAVVPVAGRPALWAVLVRPAGAATWRLVTPPGVSDSGGLVAAGGPGGSLTVAVLPRPHLRLSTLATTANSGVTWSMPAPLRAGVVPSAGALASEGGRLLAVEANGTIAAGFATGASWRALPGPDPTAAATAGGTCGGLAVTSVSFGLGYANVLAAGRCPATGSTGLFSRSVATGGDGWRQVSLPVAGRLRRLLPGGTMLLQSQAGLTMLWNTAEAFGWYAYAPLSSAKSPVTRWKVSQALPVTGPVVASGELAGATPADADGVWVLLPGGRAATISGPGKPWLLLPPLPAGTVALASGPSRATDALAVSGATLTVWRLAPEATVWTRISTTVVPAPDGS